MKRSRRSNNVQQPCLKKRRTTRTIINYAESDHNEDSDSDFEAQRTRKDSKQSEEDEDSLDDSSIKPKGQIKKSVPKRKSLVKNEPREKLLEQSFLGRPNLSEDESSESDNDEPLANFCKVSKSSVKNPTIVKGIFQTESKTDNPDFDETIPNHGTYTNVTEKSLQSSLRKRNLNIDNQEVKMSVEDTNALQASVKSKIRKDSLKLKKRKKMFCSSTRSDTGKTQLSNNQIEEKLSYSSNKNTVYASSDESGGDWEDVDEANIKFSPKKKKAVVKKEEKIEIKDLQISVGVSSIHKKKRTRQEKWFLWLRQIVGRIFRECQILVHKCHLLGLLARALKGNELSNNEVVMAVCVSLVPHEYLKPIPNRWDVSHLRKFIVWFQKDIPSVKELSLFIDQEVEEIKILTRVHIFVIMLRALGFLARLVLSLQPCSPKVKQTELSSPNTNSAATPAEKNKSSKETIASPYFAQGNKDTNETTIKRTERNKHQKKAKVLSPEKNEKNNSKGKERNIKNKNEQTNTRQSSNKSINRRCSNSNQKANKTEVSDKKGSAGKNKRCSQRGQNQLSYNEDTEQSEHDGDDDDDFDMSSMKTPRGKKIVSSTNKAKKTAASPKTDQLGIDEWIEVYLPTLQKWICVELVSNSINEPEKCEQVATKPLKYVIAIDNAHKVKDVTCRYATKWLSYNRKLRIDRDWWAQTLDPYKPANNVLNSVEDAQLKKKLLEQDFPKTVSEFKDNPLYALKRHLLKFEAIYPESAVPLGYIRNEAIYSRDCVHTLHTRETWMKDARTVKQGEVAYKIVKGRAKRNTPQHERDNIKVEVFGLWQTEIYVPPPVIDGKVPKNEYGNVELFKSCMLPEGAVHLPMSNMQKIARKLNIDYAPAMMGWDFHGGWSHPVIEGVVVAKEFEEKLMDAWRKDEEETRKKEKEKREKIIYDHWKSLIKGILIRHKLKNKYNFEDEAENVKTSKVTKKVTKKEKLSTTKRRKAKKKEIKDEYSDLSVSWPLNKLAGTTSLDTKGHVHIFPDSSHVLDAVSNTMMKVCSCGLKLPVDTEGNL